MVVQLSKKQLEYLIWFMTIQCLGLLEWALSNLLNSKYRSCKKIISGLDLKVQKTEDWDPKGNRAKYKLIMVALPNQVNPMTLFQKPIIRYFKSIF